MPKPETLEGQPCPMCKQKTLTLMEEDIEVPYFGKTSLFSMSCSNCKFHKADVECLEQREPCRYTFEIAKEEDIKIRVVKSSEATVKIPHITTITPGPASNGYITNIEGIFNRVKKEVEVARDTAEDDEDKQKAKNLLKKITKIMWGQLSQKIIIEDPSGNSAIISDKAVVEKLKK
ncbi:ZPR1 zinc finger domain-containing protein [Candidatus Woesearchaeota archaeon]|nr:ZPR1 zinc finger domain-containing protein [Candidatus Woesearchaeota archaeon]